MTLLPVFHLCHYYLSPPLLCLKCFSTCAIRSRKCISLVSSRELLSSALAACLRHCFPVHESHLPSDSITTFPHPTPASLFGIFSSCFPQIPYCSFSALSHLSLAFSQSISRILAFSFSLCCKLLVSRIFLCNVLRAHGNMRPGLNSIQALIPCVVMN